MKNAQRFCRIRNSQVAAKIGFRTRKSLALAALLLAAGLLSLAGCRNALHPPSSPEVQPPEIEAATGYLSLTIGRTRAGAFLADVEIDGFDDLIFVLYLDHENPVKGILTIWDWDGNQIDGLEAGQWTLTITALRPDFAGDNHVAVAQTYQPLSFYVFPGGITAVAAFLVPVPGGTGWFTWQLSFYLDGIASMTLRDIDGVPFVNNRYLSPDDSGYLELPAGQYRVYLTLRHEGESIRISRIINVYAGMTSNWVQTFTPDHLHRSFLDYFLELWNGSSWDLSWVQPEHLGILGEEEGIEGLYPHKLGAILPWFNAITRFGWHPGYSTAADLKMLVDAALVEIGAGDFFADEFDGGQSDAEDIIQGFVRNGTSLAFEWPNSNRVVATLGDRYAVEIYVRFPAPDPLVISFDGNGHTAGTVPAPMEGLAGVSIQIPGPGDLGRDGLFFVGWNTYADATGTAFFAGGPFMIGDEDTTLYAIWSEFEFDSNSGAITGFSGTGTDLLIPATINTVQVSAIGDYAFADMWLSSITIPDGVAIASANSMGTHGESFLALYESKGRRAGTYVFIERDNRWVFTPAQAAFTISLAHFQDQAPGDIAAPDVSYLALSEGATIVVVVGEPERFDSIRWFVAGNQAPADAVFDGGATLTLGQAHINRIGQHRVTVEVVIDGRPYSRAIAFTVRP